MAWRRAHVSLASGCITPIDGDAIDLACAHGMDAARARECEQNRESTPVKDGVATP